MKQCVYRSLSLVAFLEVVKGILCLATNMHNTGRTVLKPAWNSHICLSPLPPLSSSHPVSPQLSLHPHHGAWILRVSRVPLQHPSWSGQARGVWVWGKSIWSHTSCCDDNSPTAVILTSHLSLGQIQGSLLIHCRDNYKHVSPVAHYVIGMIKIKIPYESYYLNLVCFPYKQWHFSDTVGVLKSSLSGRLGGDCNLCQRGSDRGWRGSVCVCAVVLLV